MFPNIPGHPVFFNREECVVQIKDLYAQMCEFDQLSPDNRNELIQKISTIMISPIKIF